MKAKIIKLMSSAKNEPYAMCTEPRVSVASRQESDEKSGATRGMTISFTKELTSVVLAAPIIKATAKEMILYSLKKAMNSLVIISLQIINKIINLKRHGPAFEKQGHDTYLSLKGNSSLLPKMRPAILIGYFSWIKVEYATGQDPDPTSYCYNQLPVSVLIENQNL